jgi:hypothetical protein
MSCIIYDPKEVKLTINGKKIDVDSIIVEFPNQLGINVDESPYLWKGTFKCRIIKGPAFFEFLSRNKKKTSKI